MASSVSAPVASLSPATAKPSPNEIEANSVDTANKPINLTGDRKEASPTTADQGSQPNGTVDSQTPPSSDAAPSGAKPPIAPAPLESAKPAQTSQPDVTQPSPISEPTPSNISASKDAESSQVNATPTDVAEQSNGQIEKIDTSPPSKPVSESVASCTPSATADSSSTISPETSTPTTTSPSTIPTTASTNPAPVSTPPQTNTTPVVSTPSIAATTTVPVSTPKSSPPPATTSTPSTANTPPANVPPPSVAVAKSSDKPSQEDIDEPPEKKSKVTPSGAKGVSKTPEQVLEYMDKTFDQRRKIITKQMPTIPELKKLYPDLFMGKQLLIEFLRITKIDIDQKIQEFCVRYATAVIGMAKSKKGSGPVLSRWEQATRENETLKQYWDMVTALCLLPLHFGENFSEMVQEIGEDEEVVAQGKIVPTLVARGNIFRTDEFFLIAENTVVQEFEEFTIAFASLYSSYWVFNMVYPDSIENTYNYIQRCIVRQREPGSIPTVCKNFTKALQKWNKENDVQKWNKENDGK